MSNIIAFSYLYSGIIPYLYKSEAKITFDFRSGRKLIIKLTGILEYRILLPDLSKFFSPFGIFRIESTTIKQGFLPRG